VPTYYHFAQPNANRLLLVADSRIDSGSENFKVDLPATFIFHENSWSHYCTCSLFNDSVFMLNGSTLNSILNETTTIAVGLLSASQLPTGRSHEVIFTATAGGGGHNVVTSVGLALIYEVP